MTTITTVRSALGCTGEGQGLAQVEKSRGKERRKEEEIWPARLSWAKWARK